MKKITEVATYKNIIILVSFIGFMLLAVSWYVANREADLVARLSLLIANQEATLITVAEVTARDGADPVVESIVKDCSLPERERFDLLLSSLGTLKRGELDEVDRLFASCGNFYAQRKAVMVARFKRELEVYEDYIDLLSHVDSRADTITYPTEQWKKLVDLEQERSNYFTELVNIQGDIISALKEGASVDATEITDKVVRAQEVKDNLSYTAIQIDRVRSEVLDL